MESMPVASRSRKQRERREKELREKNKRARLAARNEHWKKNAAKMRNPSRGGGDDNDEENVVVVDESTYLKRTSVVGEKESTRNVDVSFEESSDDSVQVVGERWNPLGAGFDNNEDGDDADGAATDFQPGPSKASSKGCSDHGVASEDSGAASDGPLESLESDDKVSDEDFLVDEAEMHTAYSSESSQYHSGYASEKEGKWKRKTSAKKINDRFLEEDIQSNAGLDEKIQTSDEFDEDYLQSLKCNYGIGSRSNQGDKAGIFGSSVNGGKRKRGRPPKNRSPVIEYEAEDSAMSDNYDCSKNGSFIQSSPVPYHSSSKDGATKKRGRPRKNTCEIIRSESESESENDPIGVFAKSENGGYRKRGRLPYFEGITDGDEQYLKWLRSLELSGKCRNAGNRKPGRPPKGINVGADSEPGNELKPMNGGYRKRGRPPKNIFETESESEKDLVWDFEKFENGGNRERGKVGADFETENELKPMSGYRKRGRPPKKTIVEAESESENNIFGEFGKFENRGNRESGTLSQFADIQDGDDELYMEWLRNLELSVKCENGGNSKRGRPPKRMNMGVASEPENYGHQQRGRLPKNGWYGKRGRPPKNWNKEFDSETVNKRSRGRPPKNLNKEFDSETGNKRSRGRPPKNLNKGFNSERGCKRSRGRPPNISRI
ncbi:uncharacterized protein LOC141605319 [Silene latifolia]|uniref:uncharacterized protein LOC141605319 n=1 Tax=Silene latifolia TaxID=37657 RepID=UPI003D78A1D3